MAAPHVVQIFPADSADPVPDGVRVDQMIYAPALMGVDPTSGQMAPDLLSQMEQALDNMAALLERAGASLDNVGRVTGYVTRAEDREPIYEPWDARFPDPQDRPAFKVLVADLPKGALVQLGMHALAGARRQRFDVPGVPARDPTVKVGPWVFSSRVHGTDRQTSQTPEDGDGQAECAFDNLRSLIELAGGNPGHMTQITAFVHDAAGGQLARRHFERAFPDLQARPAFHVLEAVIRPHLHLMLEMVAVTSTAEQTREIHAYPERTPIPAAVQLGSVLYMPAITGRDPASGQLAGDFEDQLRQALRTMQVVLERAGATLAHVGHVTVFMTDLDLKPVLNTVWSELYPDPSDRPPHKYVPASLPDGQLVQLQVFAVPGAARRVLAIPGLQHADPMSLGATIGGLLFSSRIVGTDTSTGRTPPEPDGQVDMALRNVRTLLTQGGSAHLTQVTAFVNDPGLRAAVLRSWEEMFPGPADRPDLHFLDTSLPGPGIRLEIIGTA